VGLVIALRFVAWFIAAYIYGHIAEWFIHKYILHNFGKKYNSLFSFHYREHHKNARKNQFYDPVYLSRAPRLDAAGKEIVYLAIIVAMHVPVVIISYGAYAALVFSSVEYYYKHRRAHTDPKWAKTNLMWHYDHHMGKNQDANWGVRYDAVDRLLGTRVRYEYGDE
jgi:hypothetical protein